MAAMLEQQEYTQNISLSNSEKTEIDNKVNFELNNFQHKMILFGGMLNILAGLFIIYSLQEKVNMVILWGWFIILVCCDAFNIGFSYRNRHITPDQKKAWCKAQRQYHFILGCLCLTFGSVGILYTANDFNYQLYLITFLQFAIVGWSFGTVTDYIACVISNICLLLPYMSFHLYRGIMSVIATGNDPNLDISQCLTFFVLGSFLVMATYFGYRLIKKFFCLSFENVALSHKLENANNHLEQRVKERTIELEDSLKIVTYQATHDLLTDLPNQQLLLEKMEKAIDSANKMNSIFGIIFYSLNEMEKVSDGLGYEASNFVIKKIAQRLKKALTLNSTINNIDRVNYTVTLSRKDVFIIIVENIKNENELERKAIDLFNYLEEPIYIENRSIKLTASIGISIYPSNGRENKTLLINAASALLLAKQQGGNSINFYKPDKKEDVSKKLELETKLHEAMKKNEFILHYQPILDIRTKLICGAEALVRWNSEEYGMVGPDIFIPLTEANGIIIPLGEWVLRTACQQTKKWHQLGYANLKIAVNISSKQLQKKGMGESVIQILKEVGLDHQFIELELTESIAFEKEVIPILKKFKEMGLGLSIDDFGTGYSGLSGLKLFDIDKLKIDKSFLKDLETNEDSKAIVSNTILLAKNINVSVLAEGVETIEQLQFLKDHGCDMIQGYYVSKPLDEKQFTQFLDKQKQLIEF